MRWKQLELEQKRPLDDKIELARKVIDRALALAGRPALAFSGGKDSTVLLHLVRQVRPDVLVIYGNTGVEFPECVSFARQLAVDWRLNFHETKLLRTDKTCYKYAGQRLIWQRLIDEGRIHEVLKPDGKLKSTDALERACPPDLAADLERRRLVWPAGTRMTFWWTVDQYGWPILGKSWSKLLARRINIDTFLRFSQSQSEDESLLKYYEVLRQVKVSQACCDIIKKQPSETIQKELQIDLLFKGLMAAESRARAKNYLSRGHLFEGKKLDYLRGSPFFHCQPMATWTDDDVWAYIRRFNVPYSKLYDISYTAADGSVQKIRRNGCMGCATDMLFPDNHMSALRRTHPTVWRSFMRQGMAAEIRKLQLALRRNQQMGLLELFSATELLEMQPCVFDSLDSIGFTQPVREGLVWDPEI